MGSFANEAHYTSSNALDVDDLFTDSSVYYSNVTSPDVSSADTQDIDLASELEEIVGDSKPSEISSVPSPIQYPPYVNRSTSSDTTDVLDVDSIAQTRNLGAEGVGDVSFAGSSTTTVSFTPEVGGAGGYSSDNDIYSRLDMGGEDFYDSFVPIGETDLTISDLAFLNETELEWLIGNMTEEEYLSFIKGIENYYDEQAQFLTDRLAISEELVGELEKYEREYRARGFYDFIEQYKQNINRLLDARIYEIQHGKNVESLDITLEEFNSMSKPDQYEYLKKHDSVIQSNPNYIHETAQLEEQIKFADHLISEQLGEKYDIYTFEDFTSNYGYLLSLIPTLKHSINVMNNMRDSASYDYLFYTQNYANYFYKTQFSDEELRSVELDSDVRDSDGHLLEEEVIGSYDLMKYYSYEAYQKKHPNITPIQYMKMVALNNPDGVYIIHGLDMNSLQTMIDLESYGLDFAKKYDYLYTTNPEKIKDFMKSVQYEINDYHGQLLAQNFVSHLRDANDATFWDFLYNEVGITLEGLLDGLSTFGEGVGYTVESLATLMGLCSENRVLSAEEYKRMYILQSLISEKDKKNNKLIVLDQNGKEVSSSAILDYTKNYAGILLSNNYEISQGIGNMAPSILLSAVNPTAGMVALGVSAGGNAYHSAMTDGKSLLDSIFYGIFTGTSEAITERLFGGIPLLSEVKVVSLKTFFASMAREGFQESFQSISDLLYKAIFMDEPLPDIKDAEGWGKIAKGVLKEGVYGAITAGILQSPGLLLATYNIHRMNQYMRGHGITSTDLQQAIREYRSNHPELAKASDREIQLSYATEIMKQAQIQSFMNRYHVDREVAIDALSQDLYNRSIMFRNNVDSTVANYLGNHYQIHNEEEFIEIYRSLENTSPDMEKSALLDLAFKKYIILQGNLNDLILNWEMFVNDDLSEALTNINESDFRQFMETHSDLARFFAKYDNASKILQELLILPESQRSDYIQNYFHNIIPDIFFGIGQISFRAYDYVQITNEEIMTIFQYYPFERFLERLSLGDWEKAHILNQFNESGFDSLLHSNFYLRDFFQRDILKFVETFGLQNVIDFDNECGHIFSKDSSNYLSKMYSCYMHYPVDDQRFNFFYDSDGHYITSGQYSKEQFYDALRKMIIVGSTDASLTAPSWESITGEFRMKNPDLFLSEDAPDELKELFYSKKLSPEDLIYHPEYIEYLRNKNLQAGFAQKFVFLKDSNTYINLYDYLVQHFEYDDIIDFLKEYSSLLTFTHQNALSISVSLDSSLAQIKEQLKSYSEQFYNAILEGKATYNDAIFAEFKEKYPSLFLDESAPQELRVLFYIKLLVFDDFINHPEWMEYFHDTNLAYGLSSELSWLNTTFANEDMQTANANRLKVLEKYSSIEDLSLKELFIEYMKNNSSTLSMENVDCIGTVLSRLAYSNAIELSNFKDSFARQLLEVDNPLEALNQIEAIFLRNNLPLFGKMFMSFQVLYPELSQVDKFRFDERSRTAPGLKDGSLPNIGLHLTNDQKRAQVIFNDLLRIAYRSGERTLVDYLHNIEVGNSLFYQMQENGFDIGSLSSEDLAILEIFVSHLEVLYYNSQAGKNDSIDLSDLDLREKLSVLGEKFKFNDRYSLKDRIVRSFCFLAGIESFDQLQNLVEQSVVEQQERIQQVVQEMQENGGRFAIHNGDFIRCIGNFRALAGSLESGNFSKEFLSSITGTSESDTTPLDTDWTLVTNDSSIYASINNTPTGFGFGNVFVVLRQDNPNITVSRDSVGTLTNAPYDPRQIELFGTQVGVDGYETHWGARTGISLRDVDCIIYKENRVIDSQNPYDSNGNVNYVQDPNTNVRDDLPAIKFEIARNGYYIPVVDFSGKLLFTEEEFHALREQMQGLSFYGESSYTLSNELSSPAIEQVKFSLTEEASQATVQKREQVNSIVQEVLSEWGLSMKNEIDGDLTPGSVEFIDTGSTGRGTNLPNDGDFDFFMRLDADIMRNPNSLTKFKNDLVAKFQEHGIKGDVVFTGHGDLRIKGVHLPDGTVVDVDISFGVKTNKLQYSSDVALQDRLETIRQLYPEQYNDVIANIIFAKQFFKQAEAYKPYRSDATQGGMGGVGIENWVLQHGGSFTEACRSFLSAAIDANGNIIPFSEFQKKYQVWDFGENHFSSREDEYLHDNFIVDNMSEDGYRKMVEAMRQYLASQR